MSVERWLYGNANYEEKSRLQEFQPRLYDPGLKNLRNDLIELSRRMISSRCRTGEYRSEKCWFAGYIDEERYMVALAGEQNMLLGTQYRGSRGLFCMMALVFSGTDIGLYRQDEGLFEPLKKLMRQVNEQEGARCDSAFSETELIAYCQRYKMVAAETSHVGKDNNILHAEKGVNDALWMQSLLCPVALNILSKEDAVKLIDRFKSWRVTVMENVQERYQPVAKLSAIEKRMQQDALHKQISVQQEKPKEAPSVSDVNEYEKQIVENVEKKKWSQTSSDKSISIWVWVILAILIVLLLVGLFSNGKDKKHEDILGANVNNTCFVGRYEYSDTDMLNAGGENSYVSC